MKSVLLTLLVSVFVFGCAKNRDKERLRAGDTYGMLPKAAFLNSITSEDVEQSGLVEGSESRAVWLSKMTVVNTSDSPAGTAFVGFQGDVKIGYFNFTEKQMEFRSLSGLQEGQETENIKNPVLLNWNIEHFDFTLDETDGQTTNQEILDNFKTWNQKKYFRVNWDGQGHNDNQMMPSTSFNMFGCWEPISRQRVQDSLTLEPDHIGFKVEVVYQQMPACAGAKQWDRGDFNFTVTYMYSFRKETYSAYQPKMFDNEQDPNRYKYGHFQTVRQIVDKNDGRPQNIFYENRWAEKTQYFYFVKGFPEKYKWLWRHENKESVFGQTNALLASVGSKLRFEIYDYNQNIKTGAADGPERQFGDLRYSFINFIEELEAGGTPLGYGPSDTHPFTGEIIAANTMVWTGSLKYYLDLVDNVAEESEKDSSLMRQLRSALNVGSMDSFNTEWDQSKGIGKIFKAMAQETRYGARQWNGYTSDEAGKLQVPVFQETYQSAPQGTDHIGGGTLAGVNFLTNIINQSGESSGLKFESQNINGRQEYRVTNPYNTMDFSWLERLANPSSTEDKGLVAGGGLADFMEIFNNIEGATNRNYKGKAVAVSDMAKKHYQTEIHRMELNQQGHCIMDLEEFAGGVAGFKKASGLKFETQAEKDDFINTVLYRVSIHEFGHNLNLRHNFYGSVDQENFTLDTKAPVWSNGVKVMDQKGNVVPDKSRVQISSSVMDYLRLEDEINTPWAWEEYDVAAILDSYKPGGYDNGETLHLFCTDEHTLSSAICNRHDLGTTPSQILMSQIRLYDERYEMRNKRFGRSYWDTSGYASGVFRTMLSVKEFLPMWRTAFADDFLRKKMSALGIDTKKLQDPHVETLDREMRQVMKVSMAFYQSVIQQSRGDRDFRSIYDETTGALKQIGIISDKIYAMYFLAGDDAIFYNPNRILNHNSYLTYSQNAELVKFGERIWRNIITDRNIAMEPWFVNFARSLYAKNATNYNNRSNAGLIDAMKIIYVANSDDLMKTYGVALKKSLPAQRMELPFSNSTAFEAGDDVVIVHVNGSYYMAGVTESHVTFSLFQEALNTFTGNGDDEDSVQQFNMDVREFYRLYRAASSGLLQ